MFTSWCDLWQFCKCSVQNNLWCVMWTLGWNSTVPHIRENLNLAEVFAFWKYLLLQKELIFHDQTIDIDTVSYIGCTDWEYNFSVNIINSDVATRQQTTTDSLFIVFVYLVRKDPLFLRSLLSPWYSAQNLAGVLEFHPTDHRIWLSGGICMEYDGNWVFIVMSCNSIQMIHVAQGWMWKCTKHETRIKCLRKNPKHLTLTH